VRPGRVRPGRLGRIRLGLARSARVACDNGLARQASPDASWKDKDCRGAFGLGLTRYGEVRNGRRDLARSGGIGFGLIRRDA
jgi:hypothetical protein